MPGSPPSERFSGGGPGAGLLLGAGGGLGAGALLTGPADLAWAGPAAAGLVCVIIAAYALVRHRSAKATVLNLPPHSVGLPQTHIDIEALDDPAILADPDWRLVALNEGARALFGNRGPVADVRQLVRHPQALDAARQVLGGEKRAHAEITALGAHDGVFRVRAAATGDGRWLMTFSDVTQARLAERMRVDFVANASHELRTPLANITGFIETLLGPAEEDEPARRRFLEIMGREAARMSRLIDDLLSLSRIELDKNIRPQASLPLPPLVADVARTLAMRLEADGRRLVVAMPESLPPVTADRDQILQVLHNLLSNALKYGRSGTPIAISATTVAETVRVTVADEGDGVAAEHIPRLTERFYRVDAGRSRSLGGTGLGLAIVKHIIERHRGRLEIASRQSEGTQVSFTLPQHPPGPPAMPVEEAAAEAAPSHKRNMSVT